MAYRLTDAEILEALRLRLDGCDWYQIAARMERSGDTLRLAIKRVRAADIAESGEPSGRVAKAYP